VNDISPAIIEPPVAPFASASCREIWTALATAQGEFKTPRRTKEARIGNQYSYKYAPLEEIIDAVKEALAKNGLMRWQYPVRSGPHVVMRTIIGHVSGEWVACDYPIHAKDGAQGFASGVTYARRYGLSLVLGLAPEDDDDANVADSNAPFETMTRPANGNGAHKAPMVKPLPKEPEPQQVYDIETGEVGPHLIPVRQSQLGKADWLDWGGKLVAALAGAQSREEGEAWVQKCKAALSNCERDAPKVYERVHANIRTMRERLPDFLAAQ
jgi:hypothetical protein